VVDVRIPAAIGFINGGGPSVPTLEEIVDTKQWGRETVGTDGMFPNFNEWKSVNVPSVPSFTSPVLVPYFRRTDSISKRRTTMTTKGKVLVLVSSGHGLPLKDGKVYTGAGYYLNELTVPVRALMKEGYEITFANPKGNTPQMDVHSAVADFFGGDEASSPWCKSGFRNEKDCLIHRDDS